MKINEIIVESHRQLDEGMMDTIKSKLSSVYNQMKKRYPNFDEVFSVTKSHKSEINDIIKKLIAKKETGKVSKEDIIAAVTPLSKKVAVEVGSKNEINEGIFGAIGGGIVGGAMSPVVWFMGSIIHGLLVGTNEPLDMMNTLYGSIAVMAAIGFITGDLGGPVDPEGERIRQSKLTPAQKEKESLQKEYDALERHYKLQHKIGKMSYTQTRRMEELYNQGFR